MTKKSISTAKDDALRGSQAAIERAAAKAREIAESTGMPLVVNRNGKTVLVKPSDLDSASIGNTNDEKRSS